MSEKIAPALSPTEWEGGPGFRRGSLYAEVIDLEPISFVVLKQPFRDPVEQIIEVSERHALAALCLYGQPFGFTQEDVVMLRTILNFCREKRVGFGGWYEHHDVALAGIATLDARIAALLPPEEKPVVGQWDTTEKPAPRCPHDWMPEEEVGVMRCTLCGLRASEHAVRTERRP